MTLQVYVGCDSRMPEANAVCRWSIERRASRPVAVHGLDQAELRRRGLYGREADPLASTEFTYTRFLVPHLNGPAGWALFCDNDFLWLGDIAELFALADERYAVMVVQHDHRPPEATKLDGKVQSVYPRKNWSSLMLFNAAHPAVRALTPAVVNSQTGAFLHRFQWLPDEAIGALPETWNWLEGWSPKPAQGTPMVVHYTRGGPWFPDWTHVDYADLWFQERDAWKRAAA